MRVIKSAIVFSNVTPGMSATLAHGLSIHAHNVRPDEIKLDYPGFTATATDTTVTVTNNNLLAASCTALCEYWHTLERDMRPDPLTVDAFVASTGLGTAASTALFFPYRAATSTPVGATSADCIIGVDVNGAVAVTLPSAAAMGAGRFYWIKDAGGHCSVPNAITITPDGAETIDGSPNYTMDLAYENVMLVSDGANWVVIGQ